MQQRLPVSHLKHHETTDKVIKAFFVVHHELEYGFLEKVYQKALAIQLRADGLCVIDQAKIDVCYAGQVVGEYYADLVVDDKVIIEIKSVETLLPEHGAQLINYLKATPFEVGLLVNFGPKPHYLRKVFDNPRKEWWVRKNPG